MLTQMLYFSILDTREKNLIKSLFPANENDWFPLLKHAKMVAHALKKSNLIVYILLLKLY